MTCRRWAGMIVFLLVAFLAQGRPLAAGSLPGGKPGPGDPAPLFTVDDLEGKKTCLDDLVKSGNAVLLNFWGLRCGACIEEIGYLNPLHEKYGGQGVIFLGVNVDGVKAEIIKQMMPKMPNVPRYTVLPDPGFVIPDLYNMMAAPLSFVIGKDGRILHRHEDFQPGDEKELEKAIKQALSRE